MADEGVRPEPTAARKSGRLTAILIVAVLMIGEGVAIYFLANSLSETPQSALAAGEGLDGGALPGAGEEDQAEVEIAECRPSNRMSGKYVTFHITVSVLVAAGEVERVERLVKSRRGRLLDRVHFVFRSADPKHFNEPEWETIKRRLKHEFDRVFGDEELVKDVLIPQRLQSGSGV
jgi:hypothetical protein